MRSFQFVVFMGFCGLLAACSSAPKRVDPYSMYDIPVPAVQNPLSRPLPVDNDSYYQPPKSYNCNTIADGPSCGGG